MVRLFLIEYFKLKNTRYFWVLLILFLIFLLAVPIGSKLLLDYLISIGEDFSGLGFRLDELPLFDFVDIWQNLTWIYKSFSILLGFVAVISISNEFSYGTIKQNVIDGLSRQEFLQSKVIFIVVLSAIVSLAVFLIGLIMGLMWSPVKEIPFIFHSIEFVGAYFLHLVGFQLFCFVVALLIKRSGLTIALLIFYVFIIERIAAAIVEYHYKLPAVADFFPVNAIGNIIRIPFTKYALQETQTYVSLWDFSILTGYIFLLLYVANYLLGKRDLR